MTMLRYAGKEKWNDPFFKHGLWSPSRRLGSFPLTEHPLLASIQGLLPHSVQPSFFSTTSDSSAFLMVS